MGFNATSRSVTLFRGIILSVVTLAGVGIIPNGLAKANAQAPAVQLSTTSLNFGNQLVGTTTSVKSVTVTNVGTADLVISNIVAGGDFWQWSNCIGTLPAGTSCTLRVLVMVTLAGARNATIVITDNAPNSPQKVICKATGVAPPISIAPISVNFSPQSPGTQSAILTNTGTSTLTLSGFSITGPAAADFTEAHPTCPAQLAAGANCTINVTFQPNAGGMRAATLEINDSDPSSPQSLPLIGTGTVGPLSPSVTSLAFGNQNVGTVSTSQSITLTNAASNNLDIISIVASGDFAQTNTCPQSLAAAASCVINVSFSPSAVGARTGYITINDTEPSGLQTLTLSGTGATPATTVTVIPRAGSVTFKQKLQYKAKINGVLNTDVTWTVDGVAGGNATVGTISTTGLYIPPAVVGKHKITATSNADQTQSATVPVVVVNYVGTFTHQDDNSRTGQNINETVLTTGNVNINQFGKRFAYPVDGYIYAQPLYVPNLYLPGHGYHNVIYVATEHDSVYAFDADSGNPKPLWQVSFINPAAGITTVPNADVNIADCESIGIEVGITSTPVIDPVKHVMYVLARTKETQGNNSQWVQRLHALNILTGAEMPDSPVLIQASVPGLGAGFDGTGNISFNALRQNQRAALLLSNGAVYITWASHCDYGPYHGWVMAYDANTLQQLAAINLSPNGFRGGIWQSGGGPAADANGNVFLMTGNGSFNANSSGPDYGDSFVKLGSGSGLAVLDYFTPYDQVRLTSGLDLDVGSGGPLLLPAADTSPGQLMVGAGKDGKIYLLDRNNLGHFNILNNSQILENVLGATPHGVWGNLAYWQKQIYIWGFNDKLKAFRLDHNLVSVIPVSQGSPIFAYPPPTPTVSANGNGSGIVWTVRTDQWQTNGPAILQAWDAANVSRQVYNSNIRVVRDQAGPAVRFVVPTVANGKVYVGTQSELDVYGLLP